MSMGKKGLGRGLGALLGDDIEIEEQKDAEQGDKVVQISVAKIDVNPDQPRRTFD